MPRGRPLAPLTLTDEQQDQLNGIARSATLPYALVQRARMILASAEGLNNSAVAQRLGVTPQTVGKWRRRFRAAGIEGLHDEIRPGRPRTYDDDKVASVINRALQEKPETATHWSTRTLGQAEGLSKSTVQRWLALFGVKPLSRNRRPGKGANAIVPGPLSFPREEHTGPSRTRRMTVPGHRRRGSSPTTSTRTRRAAAKRPGTPGGPARPTTQPVRSSTSSSPHSTPPTTTRTTGASYSGRPDRTAIAANAAGSIGDTLPPDAAPRPEAADRGANAPLRLPFYLVGEGGKGNDFP